MKVPLIMKFLEDYTFELVTSLIKEVHSSSIDFLDQSETHEVCINMISNEQRQCNKYNKDFEILIVLWVRWETLNCQVWVLWLDNGGSTTHLTLSQESVITFIDCAFQSARQIESFM